MAPTASLQETIRRCTAVLVVTLGIGFGQFPGEWAAVSLLLAAGAVVYLLWSFDMLPVEDEPAEVE